MLPRAAMLTHNQEPGYAHLRALVQAAVPSKALHGNALCWEASRLTPCLQSLDPCPAPTIDA